MRTYRRDEQQPPPARPVAPGVVERIPGVYEVDPALMGRHFKQQPLPVWDTERLVSSRDDHLAWMHEHFADETLYAGVPSELDDEPD